MAEMDTMKQDISDLKHSVEMAHQESVDTKAKVSEIKSDLRDAFDRIKTLEVEMRNLKGYATELENYCISLDSVIRKHHLILNGVAESKGESLTLLAFRVFKVCCPTIEIADFDYCYRIGSSPIATNQPRGTRRVRPILVKLVKEDFRRQIFQNKLALKQTETYSNVYLNEDLPQVITRRRADIRAVYLNAKKKGHVTKMLGSKVVVDNITYHHKDLEILPPGLRLSDAKIIKVKGGYAFAGENAYLSAFAKCDFTFDGLAFDSAEKAYQHERARRLGAPDLAQQIYDCRKASECKKLSWHVLSTPEWDGSKKEVMKSIVTAKFEQNMKLRDLLLATGNKQLIEATQNTFWGASALLGSKILKNGKWTGRNEMGNVLVEVREELKRELKWQQTQSDSSDDLSVTDSDKSVIAPEEERALVDNSLPPPPIGRDLGDTQDQSQPAPIGNTQPGLNHDVAPQTPQTPTPPQNPPGEHQTPAKRMSQIGTAELNSSITTRRGKAGKNRKKNKSGGGGGGVYPSRSQTGVSMGNLAGTYAPGDVKANQIQVRSHGGPVAAQSTPQYAPGVLPPSLGVQQSMDGVLPYWFWPQPSATTAPPNTIQQASGLYPSTGMYMPPPWGQPFNIPPPPFAPQPGVLPNSSSNYMNSTGLQNFGSVSSPVVEELPKKHASRKSNQVKQKL